MAKYIVNENVQKKKRRKTLLAKGTTQMNEQYLYLYLYIYFYCMPNVVNVCMITGNG